MVGDAAKVFRNCFKEITVAPLASSPSTQTQDSPDLSFPARTTADSFDPFRRQATAFLAPKPAPGTEDVTPSFEDRVIQLQDYYDVHGHLFVQWFYKGGHAKNLGVWVIRIRKRYRESLAHPSRMGKESRGSVLAPRKLSKHGIERLKAMGFAWLTMQHNANCNSSLEDRIVELQEYYDEHGHLRVTGGYTGGSHQELGFVGTAPTPSMPRMSKRHVLRNGESRCCLSST
jgi:hypothetical protein